MYSIIVIVLLLLIVFFAKQRSMNYEFFEDMMTISRGSSLVTEIPYSEIADFELSIYGFPITKAGTPT